MKSGKKTLITGVVSVLTAATVLAGCGKPDGTTTVLKINDEEINLGEAAFYLNYTMAEESAWLDMYGINWDDTYQTATSSQDAVTFGDSLKDSIKDNIVDAVVLKQHADDYDVTIPDDLQSQIDEAAQYTYEENQDAMDEMGTSEDDIKNVLELITIQQLMYDPIVADADVEVTDEQAAECTVTYARVALTTTDTSTYTVTEKTDDEKAQLKTEMQQLLDEALASDDPASFDFSTAAQEIDSDNIAVSTSSYNDDNKSLPDEVTEAAAELSDGEIYTELIDTGDYYYIVRMDATYDEEASASNKESLISEQEQQYYQDTLDGWVNDSTVETEKAWDTLEVTDQHGYSVKTVSTSTDSSVTSGSESTTSESTTSESTASESTTSAVSSAS